MGTIAMNFFRFLSVVLLATLVISSNLRGVSGEPLHNASQKLDHSSMDGNIVQRKRTYGTKKSYAIKTITQRKQDDEYKENGSSNLCPCHLNSAQGSRCFDIMNQAVGTCRMRPCTDGFVCTSRSYATHYCFEKTNYVTKIISVGAGLCKTKKEWLTFRVPYVDIVPRGDEREKELNYDTLIRDDLGDMEPEACYA